MIAANPIFNSLTSILNRPNPRRKASMALSRIMTQLDCAIFRMMKASIKIGDRMALDMFRSASG